jgi:hypothetical protein
MPLGGVSDITEGGEFRRLRHALLTGTLDDTCAHCHHKPVVTTEQQRCHVIEYLLLKGRERTESGFLAPSEMDACRRMAEFINIAHEPHKGLSDRVYLVPNDPDDKVSALWLKKIDLTTFSGLLMDSSVENEQSGNVQFRVACNDGALGETVAEGSLSVAGGEKASLLIDISHLSGKHDIVVTTRMDEGVPNNAYAWAWVSYPVLLTADEMDAWRGPADGPNPADNSGGSGCRG